MATQLATTEQKPGQKVAVTAGGKIAAFVPNSLEEAWRLAGALAASGMLPKAYGQDQNKVMVGIMAGAELGMTPFVSLQSIAVIGNNPSLWGDGMLALVEASGKLTDIEETDDGAEATCRVNRAGRPTPTVRSFSMDDAKKAGLAGKAGPWTQYPKRMRQMRARAFALRDAFPDVLKGMKMAEEVRDYAPIDGGTLGETTPKLTAAAIIAQADVADPETGEIVDEGRADSDMGEAHTTSDAEADILAHLARKMTVIDVKSLVSSRSDELDDDGQARLREAAMARIAEIKGA